MTDNEIIQALEMHKEKNSCNKCPYALLDSYALCTSELLKDALDLINRQKAEIGRLKSIVNTNIVTFRRCGKTQAFKKMFLLRVAEIKSEAIKEFAERVCEGRVSNDPVVIAVRFAVQEMTEGV